jgi:preprotein translocase subunit SecA
VVLSKLLRAGEGKTVKRLRSIADAVNRLEDDITALTDAELRAETDVFKQRLADGETVDDLLVEAFAVAREAARRTLGQRHFDVQVMGGARCTWATSPRCAPVRARPSPACCRPTSTA